MYIRLSNQVNEQPYGLPGEAGDDGFRVLRMGSGGTVIAVGPMADAVLEATKGLDVTVLYAGTIRPFDAVTLRAVVAEQREASIVLVEPYLAGTSVPEVVSALLDRPNRVLGLGVGLAELRQYGTPRQHAVAHGLGPAGLRLRITSFLGT